MSAPALLARQKSASGGRAVPRSRYNRYPTRTFYLFASPWIIGFLALTLIPILYALAMSFTNYDGASGYWRFIGLRNYVELFTSDPAAWHSLVRTFFFALIIVPGTVSGGLGLALLVNRRARGTGFLRAVFFLPSVVPVVAAAIMWRLVFNRDAGLLNGVLGLLHLPSVTWLVDPTAFYALIIMMLWGLGSSMVISLAALQDVPRELEEAALLDGANSRQIVWNVVVPAISPVLYFQVITHVISALQVMIQPMLLAETSSVSTAASVPESNHLYMVTVYQEYFTYQRFGFGSAMLAVMIVFILALTAVLRRGSRRFVFYQAGDDSGSVALRLTVIVLVVVFCVPFVWILLTSLATPEQLAAGAGSLLHIHPQWSNYVEALTRVDLGIYAVNSLILAGTQAVLTTLTSATVGFAFARLRARGKNALFTVLLSTMMVPMIATLIPTYVLFSKLGLVGTYWPWVLWGLAGSPYMIFLFRQFFAAVPLELEDAAIMDGCGWLRTYAQIFLPLARPAIMTCFLLSFTWSWGDYLAPALLLNSDNTTLSVIVTQAYLDPHGNGMPTIQAAAAVLYMIPVLLIFLGAQRYFVSSALGSAVKG